MFSSFRCSRSLASFLKPDAGDPNSGKPDGANEAGQPVSRPLSRPSPTANLAGNWKGDPLIREVCGLKFTPDKMSWRCRVHREGVACIGKIMLDAIYIGLVFGFFMVFCIYAVGCEKL
jgi:hypothetical protein